MNNKINGEIIDTLSNVMRSMRHSMSFRSKSSYITFLQFEALWSIKKNKDIQMSDIAKHFSTTLPTATSLIDKLIAIDLVIRRDDLRDRRIVRVRLTRKGERLLRDFSRQRESKINVLLSYLSESDKKDLLRIMKKISKMI